MSLVAGCGVSQPSVTGMDELARTYGWRKYSKCSASACVEVSFRSDHNLIRDSKQSSGTGSFIKVPHREWRAFLKLAVEGASSTAELCVGVSCSSDLVVLSQGNVQLQFDYDEWNAFSSGVRAGEFELEGAFA